MHYTEDEVKHWLSDPNNIARMLTPYHISISGFLASGGQGHVFTGTFQDHEAAIKVYFPGQLLERIDREVNALTHLNCKSIVKLLWYEKLNAVETTIPIVVTELVNGENLSTMLAKKPLTADETGVIAYDSALAILNLWDEQRIVHRDLKPNNILIRPSGRACIIDLGVARHLDKTSLTATGYTWGTRGYFSPEQSKCVKQLTCKSDIYSLGIVLLECGLGAHPTNKNQQLLFDEQFFENLPEPINTWGYANLIKSMFLLKPNMRPLPIEIMQELNKYEP